MSAAELAPGSWDLVKSDNFDGYMRAVGNKVIEIFNVYLYKYENVCLSVCTPYSRPFQTALDTLAQNCFLLLESFLNNNMTVNSAEAA